MEKSPYFKGLFEGDWKDNELKNKNNEKRKEKLQKIDFIKSSLFHNLLIHLYGGYIKQKGLVFFLEMLECSRFFMVKDLHNLMVSEIILEVNVSSVCQIYQHFFSNQGVSNDRLVSYCLDFVEKNFSVLNEKDSFSQFFSPDTFVSVLDYVNQR